MFRIILISSSFNFYQYNEPIYSIAFSEYGSGSIASISGHGNDVKLSDKSNLKYTSNIVECP